MEILSLWKKLSVFNDKFSNDIWTLEVEDLYPLDDNGSLELWTLKIHFKESVPYWEDNKVDFVKVSVSDNQFNILDFTEPNSNKEITGYAIRYKEEGTNNYKNQNFQNKTVLINELKFNQIYVVELKAFNQYGSSDWSSILEYDYGTHKLSYLQTLKTIPIWTNELIF